MAKNSGALMGLFLLLERLSVVMAYISGALLTLLSLFIAADVLGRGSGKFYSGATDEISGFVMAMAVTWALAYTLTIDKHVRVDLVLGAVSAPVRRVLDWLALLLLTAFAALLAINSWGLAVESYDIGALSSSILQLPLVIPQGVMATGFTMLAAQSLLTLLVATFDPSGLARARAEESKAAPTQYDV
jgi:TRAP-type mannitol/chloroaromatic compound transport system permease small subunit